MGTATERDWPEVVPVEVAEVADTRKGDAQPEELEPGDGGGPLLGTVPFPEAARVGLAHEFAMLHHGVTDAPYPFLYCAFLSVFSAMTAPYLRLMVGREKTLTTCYVCLIGESAHGRKSTSRNAAIGFFTGSSRLGVRTCTSPRAYRARASGSSRKPSALYPSQCS